ncbi:MAG: integrase [Porphyromonadaceae bacterium]|nr:MAG: integrase [Porphyromonadaceae bacterium]
MPTINLMIRSNQPGKLVPVYLYIRTTDVQFRVKTEFLVRPEFWSESKQEMKPMFFDLMDYTLSQRDEVSQGLKDIRNLVEREIGMLHAKGKPINRECVSELVRKFHCKESPNEETLAHYIKRYIKEIENGDRLHYQNKHHLLTRYDALSVKSYKGFQTQWNLFRGKRKINFNDISLDLYYDFVKFFLKKDYSPNTIGKDIKHLKIILRAAQDEGLHTNEIYKHKEFRVLRTPVQNIYLTEEELRRLYDLPLEGTDQKVRDLFLIGCYTAQRFSDYSRIHPDMIKTLSTGVKAIELMQKKTDTKVIIPIRPELDVLLQRNHYRSPKVAEQTVNDYIKVIARTAKITEPVIMEKIRGGKRISETLPKCEFIKTHTARRSECTNMFKASIPTIEIMKISDHQTEKEFLKYILIDEEETAERLSVHPYFTQPVLRIADKVAEEIARIDFHQLLNNFSPN